MSFPTTTSAATGGTQNPGEFAEQVGDAATVRLVDWYPDDESI